MNRAFLVGSVLTGAALALPAFAQAQTESARKAEIAHCEWFYAEYLAAMRKRRDATNTVSEKTELSKQIEGYEREWTSPGHCEKEVADKEVREAQAAAELKERDRVKALPGVRIGMTPKQVIENTHWGKPETVNRTINQNGVREQWVYGSGHYLYFEHGKVTSVQTKE